MFYYKKITDKVLAILVTAITIIHCQEIDVAPFKGTIFMDPDIITPRDPSTFQSLYYSGQEKKNNV